MRLSATLNCYTNMAKKTIHFLRAFTRVIELQRRDGVSRHIKYSHTAHVYTGRILSTSPQTPVFESAKRCREVLTHADREITLSAIIRLFQTL